MLRTKGLYYLIIELCLLPIAYRLEKLTPLQS